MAQIIKIYPDKPSEVAIAKSQEIAKKITDGLGGRGIFGVELFVKGDDVYFSEVSPRPHDTGMVTMITQSARLGRYFFSRQVTILHSTTDDIYFNLAT